MKENVVAMVSVDDDRIGVWFATSDKRMDELAPLEERAGFFPSGNAPDNHDVVVVVVVVVVAGERMMVMVND